MLARLSATQKTLVLQLPEPRNLRPYQLLSSSFEKQERVQGQNLMKWSVEPDLCCYFRTFESSPLSCLATRLNTDCFHWHWSWKIGNLQSTTSFLVEFRKWWYWICDTQLRGNSGDVLHDREDARQTIGFIHSYFLVQEALSAANQTPYINKWISYLIGCPWTVSGSLSVAKLVEISGFLGCTVPKAASTHNTCCCRQSFRGLYISNQLLFFKLWGKTNVRLFEMVSKQSLELQNALDKSTTTFQFAQARLGRGN